MKSHVDIRAKKNKIIITLSGNLGQNESDDFIKMLTSRITPEIKKVELNLIHCENISSYGIFTLTKLQNDLKGKGVNMEIKNIPDRLRPLFAMLDISE